MAGNSVGLPFSSVVSLSANDDDKMEKVYKQKPTNVDYYT